MSRKPILHPVFAIQGSLFALLLVTTSTSSRSSISEISTKRLTSTLNDIIINYLLLATSMTIQ
jgi:hypothetical protein